jgi:hypothetical protein
MSVNVKVNMKPGWDKKIEASINVGLLQMATDIHKRAIVLAPVDTRNLVNSGVIEPVMGGYRVKFGSSKVPYARRRHFENRKNPQTLGYLARAADSVARSDKTKYFRNVA